MKTLNIMNKMPRFVHKAGFQLKKHSPEILIVAGVVGTVTSTVMACKATTKLSTIMDDAKQQIDTIHKVAENPEMVPEEYTVEDSKRDLAIVYAQTGVKLVKLYAPAVALGALSLTGIIASHRILNKRNVALAAAYKVVDTSFKEYRGRVVDRFGTELDRELRYGVKAQEIEETITDEKGKEKKVKKTINVVDGVPSGYAKFFDEWCTGWSRDAEQNKMFLNIQQTHANRILQDKEYITLNEVYDMIGVPRTKAGQIVGWSKQLNPNSYVDFGIYNAYSEKARDFVNGYEKSILLDFNVDGNILDYIH